MNHLCNLKIDQVIYETGATLNLFSQKKVSMRVWVLSKDPTVWITGAGPPAPVPRPPLGGFCRHTTQNPFNLAFYT